MQAGSSTSQSTQPNTSRAAKNKSGPSSQFVMITPPNRENSGYCQNKNAHPCDFRYPRPNNQFGKGLSSYQAPRGRSFVDHQAPNQPSWPPPAKDGTGMQKASQGNVGVDKNSRLTEKSKAEYRAARKCFNCGEIGHLSRNFPRRNLLPGGSKKPPGVPSYSMEMTLVEDVSVMTSND